MGVTVITKDVQINSNQSKNLQADSLQWLAQFPPLLQLEPSAREILAKNARIVEAPIGTIGYREGGACGAYVMRLAGQSRVYKMSASGREILLYRSVLGCQLLSILTSFRDGASRAFISKPRMYGLTSEYDVGKYRGITLNS